VVGRDEIDARDRERYAGSSMIRLLVACAIALASPALAAPTAFTADVSGKGRPVLLIPGLGCPGFVWKETVAHLEKTHEVHVLNLAGFAGNKPIGRAIPGAVKDDVIKYIKEQKLEHPVIVGHSLGGFIAIWIGEAAPDLVGPIVVVDAAPSMGGGDPDMIPYATQKRDQYKAMNAKDFELAVREKFAAMFTDPKKAEHEAILAAVVRSNPRAYADALFELSTVDLRPLLWKIKVPTLVILADGEKPEKRVREQMKPVKDHQIVVLPATRHFVMHDDFAAFARCLDAFLAAHLTPAITK
jgi:N-formylmaleamate deformylase